MTIKTRLITSAVLAAAFTVTSAHAGEIGHFAPGVLNIRDFAMPEPGFYSVIQLPRTVSRANPSV